MYRNRAKAAHHLQAAAAAAAAAAVGPPVTGGGWNTNPQQQQVPFFNPASYQNGSAAAQLLPPGTQHNYYGQDGDQAGEQVAGQQAERAGSSWPGGWDPAAKHPLHENNNFYTTDPMVTGPPYGSDLHSGYPPDGGQSAMAASGYPPDVGQSAMAAGGYPPDIGHASTSSAYTTDVGMATSEYAHVDGQATDVASGDKYLTNGEATDNALAAGSYYPPEVTVDETGQPWYYDYDQQQWFPYQPQPPDGGAGEQHELEAAVEVQQQHEQLYQHQLVQEEVERQPTEERQPSLHSHGVSEAANGDSSGQPPVDHLADVTAGMEQLAVEPLEPTAAESRGWDDQAARDYADRQANWGRQDSRLSSGSLEPDQNMLLQGGRDPRYDHHHATPRESVHPEEEGTGVHGGVEAPLGPPDLVDHRPTTSQPEIVSDLTRMPANAEGGFLSPSSSPSGHPPYATPSSGVPPPDMFASLPGAAAAASSHLSSQNNVPDLAPSGGAAESPAKQPPYGSAPDVMATAPPLSASFSGFAPDITAQSVIQNSSHMNNMAFAQPHSSQSSPAQGPPQNSMSSHDQHYDFYNRQLDPSAVAMPDIMAGRGGGGGSGHLPPLPPSHASLRPSGDSPQSCGKAPDILRTEPLAAVVVPSSDRNVYMETGELMEEDAARVSQQPAPAHPLHLQHHHPSSAFPKPSSGLPPMDGGNELPLSNEVRMVVGESDAVATPANSSQRMVEGESSSSIRQPALQPQLPPPPPPSLAASSVREVEGESGQEPPLLLSVSTRTIEGEDGPPPHQNQPQQPLPPPPLSGPSTTGPVRGGSALASAQLPNSPPIAPVGGRGIAPGYPSPQQLMGATTGESPSIFSSTLLDSSPIYPPPGRAEARSAAAGSERRDQSMMGGPPPSRISKPPPLPTPGRDIAGEEAVATSYSGARRRGDEHKKSTYDSDDVDRNQDSDLESDRDREPRYPAPRRTVSPGARSGRLKPSRPLDRYHRSSTDRDEDSDRRGPDYYRRDDTRRFRDDYDRDGGRRLRSDRRERYREGDEVSFREGGRRDAGGRHERTLRGREAGTDRTLRYREDTFRRGPHQESDFDADSYYGEDLMNRSSRPSSRAGSVSQYDPNESYYGRGVMSLQYIQQQQYMQQQYMQQLAMMNPLQYQLQSAVREMEKALVEPKNVAIYKQHWDVYSSQPLLLEKLKLEDPVRFHLLQHFRQKFWHLVEETKPAANQDKDSINTTVTASNRPEYAEKDGGEEEEEELASLRQEEAYQPPPHRLTPLLFTRPHVCARISSTGLLVKVEASSPQEGQNATVELHSMAALLSHTREYRQLAAFPGPLKPRETHKNDVIKFCERKIHESRERRMLDRESYVLLWNMLILLLRQKGQVEGSDLADLLLADKARLSEEPSSRQVGAVGSRASSLRGSTQDVQQQQQLLEDSSTSSTHNEDGEELLLLPVAASRSYVNPGISQEESVGKFRSYLLHGNKQEGLEYAMKAGLWGHALFLASKMDQRTYAGVMTRFANGLAINDPLQTLYQLMSARMPAAMKHCADQRWGDWRPHLAMILSNPLQGSDINRRSMLTLGDTLASKGLLYAAQFCYIVSAVEFGSFSKKSSKLVLLCSSVGEKSVDEFATNEAIQCTEIYEFVQQLGNHEYEMPTLQPFKLLHAVRLSEVGLVSRAQDYCREIAGQVARPAARLEPDFLPDFLHQLLTLSERLKYQDPVYTTSSGEWNEIPDPDWLVRLREVVHAATYGGGEAAQADYSGESGQAGTGQYGEEAPASLNYDPNQQYYEQQYGAYDYHQEQADHQQQQQEEESAAHAQQNTAQYDANIGQAYDEQGAAAASAAYEQNYTAAYNAGFTVPTDGGYDTGVGPPREEEAAAAASGPPTGAYDPVNDQAAVGGGPTLTMFNPNSFGGGDAKLNQQPPSVPGRRSSQASLSESAAVPGGLYGQPAPGGVSGTAAPPPPLSLQPPVPIQNGGTKSPTERVPPGGGKEDKKKPAANKNSSGSSANSKKSSWLGGIFGKLVGATNQVHLPDDSDKKIVYDEKLGRWVNLDGDEDDLAPAAPPPMDPAFASGGLSANPPGSGGLTPSEPSPSGFRAQPGKRRGRGYVDVFSQAGATKPVPVSPMMLMGDPMAPPSPGAAGVGMPPSFPAIFNPTLTAHSHDDIPSSVMPGYALPAASDEVANSGGGEGGGPASMPMMFNPSYMTTVTAPPAF